MTALPHDNDLNQSLFETPRARNNSKILGHKLLQSFISWLTTIGLMIFFY